MTFKNDVRMWAKLVLRHRKAIVIVWDPGCGHRAREQDDEPGLSLTFRCRASPETETAHKMKQTIGSGGETSPYIATVTQPAWQTITGHEAGVARMFNAVG